MTIGEVIYIYIDGVAYINIILFTIYIPFVCVYIHIFVCTYRKGKFYGELVVQTKGA